MIYLLVFWVFVASTVGLSWRAAKSYDRRLIIAVIFAIFATLALDAALGVVTAAPWVWLVDLGFLIFLVQHVIRSEAYWPLWFAGFHSVTVITSISAVIFVSSDLAYFQTLAGFWAIPALLIMALGSFADQYSVTGNTLEEDRSSK